MATEVAPRAVRRRLSADERRDALVVAAVAVVAERGYEHAPVDVIAQRAGVSKGLVWHYFEDRDALMAEAARRTLVALRAAVGADVDLAAPVPDLIRAAIGRAAALLHTHRAELKAVREIAINLRNDDGTARLGIDEYEETYQRQEEIFRRGQTEGTIRDDLDVRAVAVTYQGAVDAMLAYLDAHPGNDPDVLARALADILLGGITV